MKRTIYGIFTLLLFILLAGCTQDEVVQPEIQLSDDGKIMVRFSAMIPEYNTLQTRANGGVNDMYVLVFDQSGTFITRELAPLTNQTETEGTFTATLPSSTNARIVHFICNYDWSSFSNSGMIGVNEQTVVGLLSTTNATFWARRELPGGINAGSFPSSSPIELLRNQAKMSVTNDATNFTLQGFTIHNTPNKSSAAPFNTATTSFAEHAITEPIGMGLNPALQSNISATEKYLFERKNRSAAQITTVIVQGKYGGTSYFYKIDLIDSEGVRYDIERNYHYMVKIKTVTKAGYTSFNDALTGASHNNTALDPIIEKYPIISDGVSKLQVEKTLIVVTEPNKTINVWANYYPDINSTIINNSDVTVTILSNDGALDGTIAYNSSSGIITIKSASVIGGTVSEALIRVRIGELVRTIRVVLRTPFSFNPITINNLSPANVSIGQGGAATLRFTIPADFPTDLFPLPIKIYTQGLYPALPGLEMAVIGGEIHYIYKATTTGVQTVQFKANKSNNSETIALEANYFIDGAVGYGTAYRGSITYGSGFTNMPAGATVTASVGNMQIGFRGKYSYVPPGASNNSTPVTLTYFHLVNSNTNNGIQQSFEEVYTTVNTTVGALNNGAFNFSTVNYFRVIGRITWYRNTSNGGDVPANGTLTVTNNGSSTITRSMLSAGRYQLIINGTPANGVNITISYTTGSLTYTATKSIATLTTDQYYDLKQ